MPATIAERHEAVDELRPRLDLREDLELLGAEVRAGSTRRPWRPGVRRPAPCAAGRCRWPPRCWPSSARPRVIGWLFFGTGLLPLLIVAVVDLVVQRWPSRGGCTRSWPTSTGGRTTCVLLSEFWLALEREPFEAPLLRRLRAAMETEGTPASTRIRRLARLLHLLDQRRNQFFAPFAALWQWTTLLAIRIDAWRGEAGPEVARWIRAVGEFEALCALGAYAAENPDDPFPELVPGPARYEAEALGHPLIPADVCVRNDIDLGVADAGPDRQRLEHVGQEHVAPDRRASTRCSPSPAPRSAPAGSGSRR